MATNPMQRKVRSAFFIGFLVALVIGAIAVYFMYSKLQSIQKENQKEEQTIITKNVYIVNDSVKSGDRLKGKITYKTLVIDTVPTNSVTYGDLAQYVITADGASMSNIGDFLSDEVIAKINLEPGTILTRDMLLTEDSGVYKFTIAEENGERKVVDIQKDSSVRMEEYNMFILPSKLQAGQYIDIRLQLPTGETFIVASKKYVEDTNETTVWLKMSEAEILTMNNAIVEAYTMTGSKLYADIYVEAGSQDKAEITYVPADAIEKLISRDPNVIDKAKEYLSKSYTAGLREYRTRIIDSTLENVYGEDRLKNTESGIKDEVEKLQSARQKYMEQLGAYSTPKTTTSTTSK